MYKIYIYIYITAGVYVRRNVAYTFLPKKMLVAVSEQGLKIMAMLYLTPVLPLGLVSYMCGTTAMDLRSFAFAKIASLPLYLMYTFMGASAHSFIKGGKGSKNTSDMSKSVSNEALELEENQILIVSGLVLSIVMMTLITRNIHKELMKVRPLKKELVKK